MTQTRSLKRLLVLWSSIFYCFARLQNGFSHIQHGYRLDRKVINFFDNYSILDCVDHCLRTTRCKSVNYHHGAKLCEINFGSKEMASDNFILSNGWIYTTAINWIKELTGACSNSNCDTNETCIPLPSGNYTCVLSDCGVPVIPGADMNSVRRWDAIGIRRTMVLDCLLNYHKVGTGLLRCLNNGEWTIDLNCGWHTYGKNQYLFFPDLKTWDLAKKQCEGNAAYLAEIESREENDWISSLIRDYCVKDSHWCYTWIGARDIVHEGVFTWGRYGNQVTFTHWALGQPDNAGSVEHCVHLYADGLWNDMPCQVSISFVCEKNIELNNQSDGVIITREQV